MPAGESAITYFNGVRIITANLVVSPSSTTTRGYNDRQQAVQTSALLRVRAKRLLLHEACAALDIDYKAFHPDTLSPLDYRAVKRTARMLLLKASRWALKWS
jgi:hypothetical protein